MVCKKHFLVSLKYKPDGNSKVYSLKMQRKYKLTAIVVLIMVVTEVPLAGISVETSTLIIEPAVTVVVEVIAVVTVMA